MTTNQHRIFIDANVFIGAYRKKCSQEDVDAIKRLYEHTGKRLYTSSLCIAELAATLQKELTDDAIRNAIEDIRKRVTVLSFTNDDITAALRLAYKDIEDNMQYVVAAKMKCLYFVTNNSKDFRSHPNIIVLRPRDTRTIPR